MKSLERRFNNIEEKFPFWSSFTCFAEAVREQGFSRSSLHRWFQKLVKKEDYSRKEKKALLGHLDNLSKPARTPEIEGKTAP